MRERVRELEALLEPLREGHEAARAEARAIARALRGSGGSFGFSDISDLALLVERSAGKQVLRCTEGFVVLLRKTAWPDDPARHASTRWMERALELIPDDEEAPRTVEEAWDAAARRSGLEVTAVAERISETYGLEPADLDVPTGPATRLVPEGLMRDRSIVPLSEDGVHIFVAVADPTDLHAELALERVTGRRPVYRVAPPEDLLSRLDTLRHAAGARSKGRPTTESGSATEDAPAVLLVDDDDDARLLARAALERRGGFHILEAEDGEEGLERLVRTGDVDLVVVDLDMPRVGGRELVRRLRANPEARQPPVIVVTGAEDPQLEADLIEEGADDYIRKPLDPRLFLARVTATLRRSTGGLDTSGRP